MTNWIVTNKLLRVLAAPVVVVGMLLALAAPALAAEGCTSASGGYVCTLVNNSGSYVRTVSAIRAKIVPWDFWICRSSAWAYYVPPGGGAIGLGYQSRDNCAYVRAYFDFAVYRNLPSGSRVCTKFMEYGTPVGGEPCVSI